MLPPSRLAPLYPTWLVAGADPWGDVNNKTLGFLREDVSCCSCRLPGIPLLPDVGSLNVHV